MPGGYHQPWQQACDLRKPSACSCEYSSDCIRAQRKLPAEASLTRAGLLKDCQSVLDFQIRTITTEYPYLGLGTINTGDCYLDM